MQNKPEFVTWVIFLDDGHLQSKVHVLRDNGVTKQQLDEGITRPLTLCGRKIPKWQYARKVKSWLKRPCAHCQKALRGTNT